MFSRVSIQVNMPTVASKKRTTPILITTSKNIFGSSFQSSSLYTISPKNSAHKTATAAASVGVNIPENIPPSSITGVKSARKDL